MPPGLESREVFVCECVECATWGPASDRSGLPGPNINTEGKISWRGHWYGYDPAVGYYVSRRTVDGKRIPFLLHRETYETHVGPIPEGFIVHHRNHNPFDNRPDNLVAITRSEHNLENDHGADALRAYVAGHTPEEWGQRTRDNVWANRKPRDVTCVTCGTVFQSTGMRAKYCDEHSRRRRQLKAREARAGLQPPGR